MVDEESEETEETEEQLQIVHDDIVQRLLAYQRQLREGTSPAEATEVEGVAVATDTIEVVDLTTAEAELEAETEPSAPETSETEPSLSTEEAADEVVLVPEAELEAEPGSASMEEEGSTPTLGLSSRVEQLEAMVARVGDLVGELRISFQEMAIDADERLAAIEDAIAVARSDASGE